MSNAAKLRYFKVKKINTEFLMEFCDLMEFHRFLEYNQVRTIFLVMNEEDSVTHFAASYKGGLLQQDNLGFETIEDYLNSLKDEFPDAQSFYKAKEIGCRTYKDFTIVDACGINEKEIFEKIKEAGFIDSFADYIAYKTEHADDNKLGNFDNAFQLYNEATGNGFEDYTAFKEARIKGFKNRIDYDIAKEKGYDNAADYEIGLEKGFHNYEIYKLALDLQIRDRFDMEKYTDLKVLEAKAEYFDQRVLLTLLSKLPQDKKVSINKLNELLEKSYDDFKYEDTQQLPPWFTKAFENIDSIKEFLKTNDNVKEYGHYDADGEFFEAKKLRDRKVVIDGSNVAHKSAGKSDSKPLFSNILLMIKDLKKRGITEISVISDAALKYRIGDKELLPELEKECEYLEAPAETSADVFIIKYVKQHHCLLISNDTFREWKAADPWIAANIDYYRLTFMINNDTVLIPDLD